MAARNLRIPADGEALQRAKTHRVSSFSNLGLPTDLVEVLTGQGITEPTPIQAATLPDSLAGREVTVTAAGRLGFDRPASARLWLPDTEQHFRTAERARPTIVPALTDAAG